MTQVLTCQEFPAYVEQKTIMQHCFKKYCITNAFDDIAWYCVKKYDIDNSESKSDSQDLYFEYNLTSN